MVDGPIDHAILAVSIIAVLLGVTMLASGEIAALAPVLVGIMGFAYLKADFEQFREWMDSEGGEEANSKEDALEVLRNRYASGEIEQDEFDRKLDDLLETETVEQAEIRQQNSERVRESE